MYIGSFLVTFSMLVLVALGCTTIPGIIKSIILIVTVLGFYLGGFILLNNQKLKKVGITYLTVASIATPLMFLGIWNYNLSTLTNLSFSLYWEFISIILISINLILFKIITNNSFFTY